MNAKHTPGPWGWDVPDRLIATVGARCGCDHKVCVKDFGEGWQTVVHQCDTLDAGPKETNCQFDQALMAAAPELFDAVVDLLHQLSFLDEGNTEAEDLIARIQEGTTPKEQP